MHLTAAFQCLLNQQKQLRMLTIDQTFSHCGICFQLVFNPKIFTTRGIENNTCSNKTNNSKK